MNELPDNNGDEARRLLRNVQSDLRAVRLMVDAEEIVGRIVCTHAHLTVEKALTAALVHLGIPFRKTHDLVALHALTLGAGAFHGVQRELLERLNRWAIDGRYTDDMVDASRKTARWAATVAERVVAEAKSLIEGA